jgi:hypothetical protein
MSFPFPREIIRQKFGVLESCPDVVSQYLPFPSFGEEFENGPSVDRCGDGGEIGMAGEDDPDGVGIKEGF